MVNSHSGSPGSTSLRSRPGCRSWVPGTRRSDAVPSGAGFLQSTPAQRPSVAAFLRADGGTSAVSSFPIQDPGGQKDALVSVLSWHRLCGAAWAFLAGGARQGLNIIGGCWLGRRVQLGPGSHRVCHDPGCARELQTFPVLLCRQTPCWGDGDIIPLPSPRRTRQS